MTYGEMLKHIAEQLAFIGSQSEAAFEARLILCASASIGQETLIARMREPFPGEYCQTAENMLLRRLKREPLQYILGEWEFMGLPFNIRAGALIPRQDTESIVEYALKLSAARGYSTALDMCSGSGCIGVSMAKLGGLCVLMADISKKCVALSTENAAKNGVNARAVQSDMFSSIPDSFDIIICNPPYIAESERESLTAELAYEPETALFAGADGLSFYRRLAREYEAHLNCGGALVMETGLGQPEKVLELFGGGEIIYDITGRGRGAVIFKQASCAPTRLPL